MVEIREIFNKQGGMNLIKQYIKAGTLITAVSEFLLLGKSRTALEILRLAVQMKTKQNLFRKYGYVLDDFDKEYEQLVPGNQSNKIWVCWFQGLDDCPKVVRRCFASLKKHLRDREIILITSENLFKYVDFPDYIIEKWHSGIITHTHMTDLLRLELLIRYGGTWVDATVLCTRDVSEIPDYFFDSPLFLFQTLKPGKDGHPIGVSSWYLSACSNNRILMATRKLCYEYWKTSNSMVDYYLLHYFLMIALERYEDDRKQIVPYSNATPHILLLRLFDEYDETMYNRIKDQSPFHKLSYKFSDEQMSMPDTYYKKIIIG